MIKSISKSVSQQSVVEASTLVGLKPQLIKTPQGFLDLTLVCTSSCMKSDKSVSQSVSQIMSKRRHLIIASLVLFKNNLQEKKSCEESKLII